MTIRERAETLKTLAALSGFASLPPAQGSSPPIVDGELARVALVEQVAPMLGARIASGALRCTPGARATLVSAHLACLAADRWAEETRAPLLAALHARSIPAMLLKGGALVGTVYGRLGLRLMSDLDVLVPAGRWGEAQRALREAGGVAAPAEALVVRLGLNHERSWSMPSGALLDLHRALTAWPLFHVDHSELFARAQRVGDEAVPAPDDLFVSLALHAAQDGFVMPLRSVVDGLAMAAAGNLAADTIVSRARAWGAGRAMGTWLRMLVAHGLPGDPWSDVAAVLDPRGPSSSRLGNLPRPVPQVAKRSVDQWDARWQLVRSHDAASRPLVFLGYRGVLRMADTLRAQLSRRRRVSADL